MRADGPRFISAAALNGPTLGKADEKAFAKYPNKLLCFVRIGSRVVMPLKTW